MNKYTTASLIVSAALIFGAYLLVGGSGAPLDSSAVTMENGTQVITIEAKNGYSPQNIAAKAGVPSVIRFVTKDTYDCSASVTIPKLGFNKLLSSTDSVEVPVSKEIAQGTLNGTCGMGMKNFKIQFN